MARNSGLTNALSQILLFLAATRMIAASPVVTVLRAHVLFECGVTTFVLVSANSEHLGEQG